MTHAKLIKNTDIFVEDKMGVQVDWYSNKRAGLIWMRTVVAVVIFCVISVIMEAKIETYIIIIGLAVVMTILNFADYYKYKKRRENKDKDK